MAPSIESSAEPNLERIAPGADITTSTSLLHHDLVTKNSEALQFRAAATLQLRSGSRSDDIVKLDDRLISSPYNEAPHLLDLKTLDTPARLLAKALTVLKPIRDDYATAPYAESFNWQEVVDLLPQFPDADGYTWQRQELYVVVFRSRLRPGANVQLLQVLDIHSHREANASGGLLKYWFGNRNENNENLATCKFPECFLSHMIIHLCSELCVDENPEKAANSVEMDSSGLMYI